MPAMTANDNQVSSDFIGEGMDFCFRSAKDQVAIRFFYTEGLCKFSEVGLGGILDLFLDR